MTEAERIRAREYAIREIRGRQQFAGYWSTVARNPEDHKSIEFLLKELEDVDGAAILNQKALNNARASLDEIAAELQGWIDDLVSEGGARKTAPFEDLLRFVQSRTGSK